MSIQSTSATPHRRTPEPSNRRTSATPHRRNSATPHRRTSATPHHMTLIVVNAPKNWIRMRIENLSTRRYVVIVRIFIDVFNWKYEILNAFKFKYKLHVEVQYTGKYYAQASQSHQHKSTFSVIIRNSIQLHDSFLMALPWDKITDITLKT